MSRRGLRCSPLPEVTGLSSEEQFSLGLGAASALHPADTDFLIAAGRLQEAKSTLPQQQYNDLHNIFLALEEQRKAFNNVVQGFPVITADMAAAIHAYAQSVQQFKADVDEAAGPDLQTLHAYRFPSPDDVPMADYTTSLPGSPSIPPLDELNLSCPGAYAPGFPRPMIDGDDVPTPSAPDFASNSLGLTGMTRRVRQSSRHLPNRSGSQEDKPEGGSPDSLRPNLTVETNINHHFHQDQPILYWRDGISDEPDSMDVDEDSAMSSVNTASSSLTPLTPNIPFRLKPGPMPLKSPALELLNVMNEDDVYDNDTDSDTSSVCAQPFGSSRSATMESFDA